MSTFPRRLTEPGIFTPFGLLLVLTAASVSWTAHAKTVGEILSQEALAMIKTDRSRSAEPDVPSLHLIGIWGVEPNLTAQVRFRAQVVEFRQGHRRALEPFDRKFELVSLAPPCVVFRFKGMRHRRCVKGSQSSITPD